MKNVVIKTFHDSDMICIQGEKQTYWITKEEAQDLIIGLSKAIKSLK